MGKRAWLWLIPLMLIAVGFGAHGLDADPLWQDEYYMTRDVRTSNDPLALAVHIAAANPFHVPGYFIMENVWGRIFSGKPAIMRGLALFIGLLAIAVTYRLGRDLISRRVGLYGAAVLASSAFFIYYWHELRMYTLTVLAAALVLWLYLRLVNTRHEPTVAAFAGFTLSIALALYTHYFLMLFVAGVGVYHLLVAPKNARWWKISAAAILGAATLIPWLSVLLKSATRVASNGLDNSLSGGAALEQLAYVFSNGQTPLLIVLLIAALYPLIRWRGRARSGSAALWIITAATLAIVLIANLFFRFLPADRLRYIVLLFPAASLLVALGIIALGGWLSLWKVPRSAAAPFHRPAFSPLPPEDEVVRASLVPRESLSPLPPGEGPGVRAAGPDQPPRATGTGVRAALLLLWLIIGWWNNAAMLTPNNIIGYVPFFPTHVITRDLRGVQSPGDYIVYVLPDSVPPDRAGADYRRSLSYNVPNEGLAADWAVVSKLDTPAEQSAQFSQIASAIGPARHYVWLAYPTDQTPTTLAPIESRIGDQYGLCGAVEQRLGFRIDEYAPSPACCTPSSVSRAPQATFGSLALMGVDPRLSADQTALSVFVSFDGADRLPPDTYSVALHVVGADGGQPVAQTDFGLPTASFLCEPRDIALGALPPGTYGLQVIVYNWRTGQRLPATVSGVRAPDDAPVLIRLDIAK